MHNKYFFVFEIFFIFFYLKAILIFLLISKLIQIASMARQPDIALG